MLDLFFIPESENTIFKKNSLIGLILNFPSLVKPTLVYEKHEDRGGDATAEAT